MTPEREKTRQEKAVADVKRKLDIEQEEFEETMTKLREVVPKVRGVFWDGKKKWVEKLVPVQSAREDIKHIKFGPETMVITFDDGLERSFDYSQIPELFD